MQFYLLQLLTGGEGAVSPSEIIIMGFAKYSEEASPMHPHRHVGKLLTS
jgi:hypothetical protein